MNSRKHSVARSDASEPPSEHSGHDVTSGGETRGVTIADLDQRLQHLSADVDVLRRRLARAEHTADAAAAGLDEVEEIVRPVVSVPTSTPVTSATELALIGKSAAMSVNDAWLRDLDTPHPRERRQPPPPAPDATPVQAEIDSDALVQWVHVVLLPLYEREIPDVAWCPKWWEHSEAIFRLELIRGAWEAAVAHGPQALNDWSLYCADPQLAALLSPRGPFSKCGPGGHPPNQHPIKALPQEWPVDFNHARFSGVAHLSAATGSSRTPLTDGADPSPALGPRRMPTGFERMSRLTGGNSNDTAGGGHSGILAHQQRGPSGGQP